jgi:Rrf2 family protein
MLSLSHTTGYAIKALGCLDGPSPSSRLIADVAKHAGVPRPYLAKIVNSLVRNGLVATKRGYKGGISLARSAEEISLLEVVEAVEGKGWIGDCLLGLEACTSQRNCPTHDLWERIRVEITERLRTTTLAEIVVFHKLDSRIRRTRVRGKNVEKGSAKRKS